MQQRQILLCLAVLLMAPGYVLSRAVRIPDDEQEYINENTVLHGVMVRPRGEESVFFEGDIRLRSGEDPYNIFKITDHRDRSKRSTEGSGTTEMEDIQPEGYKTRSDLWEGGVVYFKYETTLSTMYREIFSEAMDMWTNATDSCITFEHANSTHEHFLTLVKDDIRGCSSYVGRTNSNGQDVTISSDCATVGHAAHELGHAIGLWHEHSRPDRNEYIEILYDNIVETKQKNFGILSDSKFSQVPPVPYDIESLMHYGPQSFAKMVTGRDQPSIRIKDRDLFDKCDNPDDMGQRKRLSFKDVLRVKLLYNCGEVSATDRPSHCGSDPTPTPSVTPSPTIPEVKVTTPTPTTTLKLRTNDVITLQMGEDDDKKNRLRHGMKCVESPGCTPTPCTSAFGGSRCLGILNQFTIINPNSSRIVSGDTVLLRSANKPSAYLSCNGSNKYCKVTTCTSNAADATNSSISNCEKHFFVIGGKGRKTGKVLSTKHKISFKSYEGDSYLNCLGKRCQLLSDGECPKKVSPERNFVEYRNATADPKSCEFQYFNVTKV